MYLEVCFNYYTFLFSNHGYVQKFLVYQACIRNKIRNKIKNKIEDKNYK